MLLFSALSFLIASRTASAFAAHFVTPTPSTTLAVEERALLSSAGLACSTVSGLVSPTPAAAVCGRLGGSDGSGYIISYTTGIYVATLVSHSRA